MLFGLVKDRPKLTSSKCQRVKLGALSDTCRVIRSSSTSTHSNSRVHESSSSS